MPSTLLSVIGDGAIQNSNYNVRGTPPPGSGKWPHVSTDDDGTSLIERDNTTGTDGAPETRSQTFTLDPLPGAAARIPSIGGVTSELTCKASGTATAKIRTMVYSNSVAAYGSVHAVASTTQWLLRTQVWDQTPSATPWTVAIVNALETGPDCERPTTGLTQCSYCFVTVVWYPHAAAGIYDLVGPLLPLAALVGAAMQRSEMPALARVIAQRTRGRMVLLANEWEWAWRSLRKAGVRVAYG